MNKNKVFKNFLNGMETEENKVVLESVLQAFKVIFESDEEFSDDVKVSPSVRRESFTYGTTPREVFDAHFNGLLGDNDYPIKPNSSLATFLDKVMGNVKASDRSDGAWLFNDDNLWQLLENLKVVSLAGNTDTDSENEFTEQDVEKAISLRSDILGTLKIEEI